jgi:plasmid stability protein
MTPRVHTGIMADVKIRKLPDWVVDTYRARAQAAGHSLEEELRSLLTEAALERQREFRRKAEKFRARLRAKYGQLSDSSPGIIQDREKRG